MQCIPVGAELRLLVTVQNDLLQQRREVLWEVRLHEGLHCDGDLIGGLCLREGSGNDSVDEVLAELCLTFILKDEGPELRVHPFHKVARL